MDLNMKTLGVLALVALAAVNASVADNPSSPPASKDADSPGFADGWRLSGILKQGDKLQASVEHAAHAPRFVIEGGEFTTGVSVEKIDATSRSVIVRKGNMIAIIRSGSAPVVVKSSPVAAQTTPQPAAQQPQQPKRPTAKAGQDANGNWGIQLSDGRFLSAQDYAARYGGTDQAVARLNSRLASDLPPERKAFAQQMLNALQNAQTSQPQASYGNAMSSGNAAAYSGGVPARVAAPVMEQPVAAAQQQAGFSDPSRVYRRGPMLSR